MPPRILIVDDEENVLSTLESFFDDTGFTVVTCSSAEAAIKEIGNGRRFDVVLTDVNLGEGENGYQLAQTVNSRWPETKVMVTSGFTQLALSIRGMPASDYPFLQKPFGRRELLALIDKELNR